MCQPCQPVRGWWVMWRAEGVRGSIVGVNRWECRKAGRHVDLPLRGSETGCYRCVGLQVELETDAGDEGVGEEA